MKKGQKRDGFTLPFGRYNIFSYFFRKSSFSSFNSHSINRSIRNFITCRKISLGCAIFKIQKMKTIIFNGKSC